MAEYTDETISGEWTNGPVWTIGQQGIWIGLPGLFIGIGQHFITGEYTEETAETGQWSD